MIRAIIFDSDGMITPSKRFSEDLETLFGVSLNKSIPFFKAEFQECLIGKKDLKEELLKQIEIWNCNNTVEELIKYWFESQSEVDQRIINIINNLKNQGIKCYLATNQEKHRTEFMKQNMGFGDLFDEVFSSADIGLKKPQQEFFEYIYKKINNGFTKEEILFCDDEPKHIEEAERFGFKGHTYKKFEDFNDFINYIFFRNRF